MSGSVSPLDEGFVRLGRAAALVAREREMCTDDDVMDLFKRALFAGELDAPPFNVGERRNHPGNWLHMEIEVPGCTVPLSQAALKVRAKQLYGVNRDTVASVLLTADALPGNTANWERLFDRYAPDTKWGDAFSLLAEIPFRDFPERGRQELKALLAPVVKLAAWFGRKGWPVPAFLAKAAGTARGGDASDPVLRNPEPRAPDTRLQGRPTKPGWPHIILLVRECYREHPDWQKKRLAYEAWQLARRKFSESELPSVATIQRSMAEILKGGSA
jgi:hypothetical protein